MGRQVVQRCPLDSYICYMTHSQLFTHSLFTTLGKPIPYTHNPLNRKHSPHNYTRPSLGIHRPPLDQELLLTGVSVEDGAGCYTSMVSWLPPSLCVVLHVIGNYSQYSVRYQLRNSIYSYCYTTVYSQSTSVTTVHISVCAYTANGTMYLLVLISPTGWTNNASDSNRVTRQLHFAHSTI